MATMQRMTMRHLFKDIGVILGVVLIWRGIWNLLDMIDLILFGGHHGWTALLGVIIGLLILYIPDRDLKELEQL